MFFWWVESGIVLTKLIFVFYFKYLLSVFNIYVSRFCLPTNKSEIEKLWFMMNIWGLASVSYKLLQYTVVQCTVYIRAIHITKPQINVTLRLETTQ